MQGSTSEDSHRRIRKAGYLSTWAIKPRGLCINHPVDVATADERDDTSETEHHVAFIARNAVPKAMTLNEVEIATANDRVLQAVMLCMVYGRWHQPPSDVSLA